MGRITVTTQQTKPLKNPSTNQSNKVLDSIPDSIKDEVKKCAREGKDILFKDSPSDEEIEKKQDALFDLACMELSKFEELNYFSFRTIEWLPHLNKKEFHGKIKKFLYKPISFHILYIKLLKSVDDDILVDICKLQKEKENKKWEEYPIYNLTKDEIAKRENGKELYYDRRRQKVTNKGDPIKIRQLSRSEMLVLEELSKIRGSEMAQLEKEIEASAKRISRRLIIISSLEGDKLHDWFKNQSKEIPLSTKPEKKISQTEAKGKEEYNFYDVKLNQFVNVISPPEPISLDSKEAFVEPVVETYTEEQGVSYPISVKVYCTPGFQRLEYQGKKVKLNNIWLRLLKFLWKKNGALAERDEIRKELWGKNEKEKDDQITNNISRLRKAFEDIGFKKETVKQKIITTRSDTFTDHGRGGGGYRFLRGIVSLGFHD